MFRLLTINILLILCLTGQAIAQQADSVSKPVAKYDKFIPTGIRVGTDLMAFVRGATTSSFTGWEVSADVDVHRYFVVAEYGYWERNYSSPDQYHNDGNYYRVGIDVNFLKNDPVKNAFFIGARYGHSTFSEHLVIATTDPVWGTVTSDESNVNINGTWYELTTGLKVKMWKVIWLGYTARFKFGLKTNETGLLVPHDVPGYGDTDKETTWGFNYQIFVRLPMKKQRATVPKN